MNKDFVPYEEALALKELGFDEPCIILFDQYLYRNSNFCKVNDEAITMFKSFDDELIIAPLYQQAFRWFREKYNLKAYIIPIEYLDGTQETHQWNIFNECHSGVEQFIYEEAELACLRKLIEIVKK